MQITKDHPDFERTIIFLNDKLCKTAMAASEEGGWVDIIDIESMAPLDLSEEGAAVPEVDENISQWEELPLKRKHGKVSIRFKGMCKGIL